jgi:hypothetical protein
MITAMRGLRLIAPVVVMLVLTSGGAAAQGVPSDAAPPGPRTGLIVGQVVEAGTGAPVAEAVVNMTMPKYANNPTAPKGRVMADADGRFFFADLPPGEYYLQATKDGHAPGTYGQLRPSGQSLRLALGEGERLADVTLRVWKYAAIAGTVVDEAGEPVVGVGVRALVKNVVAGRTQYGNMDVIPELVPAATTDDRGIFRLSQLIPGTYVVVVPSTHTTLPAAALAQANTELRSDLFFSGVTEITLLGQPRTQQIGDVALMSSSRVPIPPTPSATGRMETYRTTYFPAAAAAAAATQIAIGPGEERGDVTIALQPVPAVRVSGRLVTPEGGPPPFTTIRLVGAAMAGVITSIGSSAGGLETVSGMSDSTGRFTLLAVPAGDYLLTHANAFLSRALQQDTSPYWISQPITVGAEDLDLTVQVRPALRLEGRIEFRSSKNPPTAPPPLAGVMFETPFGEPGRVAVQSSREAGRPFATLAAGGRYVVRPYEIYGWVVQSVAAGGKDITDRVFDLQADMTSLVVTFTDRLSRVSGSVKDVRGELSPTAVVLAFPVDPKLWTGYGASPRNLKSALTTRTGVYTFEHLPPGDYYLAAIDSADMDGWQDPKTLEQLAPRATKLTVTTDVPEKTVDLTMKAIR